MWFISNGKTIFTRIKLQGDIVGDNFDRHSSRSPWCFWIKISLNGNLNSETLNRISYKKLFNRGFSTTSIHKNEDILPKKLRDTCTRVSAYTICISTPVR